MRWKEISPPIDHCVSTEFYTYAACAKGLFVYHDGKIQWLCCAHGIVLRRLGMSTAYGKWFLPHKATVTKKMIVWVEWIHFKWKKDTGCVWNCILWVGGTFVITNRKKKRKKKYVLYTVVWMLSLSSDLPESVALLYCKFSCALNDFNIYTVA